MMQDELRGEIYALVTLYDTLHLFFCTIVTVAMQILQ